ncbi:MAG TPA: endolytic transglycosylase MltG [Deltaproteobacteria bacterium]|nr:endolytic transglycosylase MltG [Deltaproteobacteria bacterium]
MVFDDLGGQLKNISRYLTPVRLVSAILALTLLGVGGWALWLWSYGVSPIPIPESAEVQIYIPPQTTFSGIRKVLVENRLIRNDRRFYQLAKFYKLTEKLKAGEYLFSPGLTHYQLLRALEKGATIQRPVTVPEGANIYQVADILAGGGWVERELFLDKVRDKAVVAAFKVQGESLEGYLFPDTYHLTRGQSAMEIIAMMVERGRQVRAQLGDLADNELKLSPHEVIILASIVEKETGVGEERPLIARVFLSRLKRKMRLQADPTVIYGLADFDGNLTKRDLLAITPYNTYQIRGLPAGPIANPGRAAIAAVLHPALESYLYFVSKNDGGHYFSKTLAEHNRAVRKYQKSKRYR